MQDFGRILRDAIRRDGRSLYQIAKRAGVTYQNVHRFARHEHENINLQTAARLAHVVGVELRQTRRQKGR